MPKPSVSFRCQACSAVTGKWYGRCPKCGEFSTLVEEAAPARSAGLRAGVTGTAPARPAQPVRQVAAAAPTRRLATGIGEFDRVIGGGLVAGQVCLCSGPPGSGKSTLLLAVADSVARLSGRPVLYVSGEESIEQIAVRAQRTGTLDANLLVADDTDLASVLGHVEAHADAALVIVDSVQTVASAEVEGRAGGVTQTMEVAQALTRVAKARGLPMIIVGQVTKDSTVAGPRALEHIVDTTLSLDGDKHSSLRLLRTVKNRFGALEVAAFEQTDTGMREVLDPSRLFRESRTTPVPGTCATVTVEGARALVAEIQALVSNSSVPNPRRAVSGLDSSRAAMLIAVTERVTDHPLWKFDVYLATAAGMRISDPGTDLAVCVAVASAGGKGVAPLDLAAFGEVTLSGDVRAVPMTTERAAEALRLGFRRLLVPVGTRAKLGDRVGPGRVVEVGTLAEAVLALEHHAPRDLPERRAVTLRPVPSGE
ncbi:DNA repair protein RadA [Jatrophihabitans endophyticus]|uniref:DNA repair protein RadA n=1 Tax=Jatrophihabitans endophyticus TaxID=1206085 RepID=UPI0019EBFAB8|nr:DNA repair protein RadA [Jatrophihabitans endophyticus]MBE7189327.1 DNA repair protein RadA [Jatrophihabitans endophyticus]